MSRVHVISPSLLLNMRIYFFEKCIDREMRDLFDFIKKYKNFSTFVEEMIETLPDLMIKFIEKLPPFILDLYEKE